MTKKNMLKDNTQKVLSLSHLLPYLFFTFLVFILLPSPTYAQTASFKKLIKTCNTVECVETRLDSLMDHTEKISTDSLADCTHEVGLKMFYLSRASSNPSDVLDKAILHTQNALKIKASVNSIDTLSVQKSWSNLGIFQKRAEKYNDAIETYLNLISLKIKNGKTINAYRYLSECYLNLGDYYKAKEILLQGIDFLPEEYKKGKYLANFHYNLADCYANIGYQQYSNEILNHLSLCKEAISKSEMKDSDKNHLDIISTFLKGNLLLKTKNYSEALIPLSQSLENTEPRDSTNLAIAHNSLGYAYLKLEEYSKSSYHLNQSINFDNQYSPALENLGDLNISNDNYLEAIRLYQEAVSINLKESRQLKSTETLKIEDLKYIPNKYYVLSHLIQEAIAWKKLSSLKGDESYLVNSLNIFQLADELIDEIRKQSIEEKSKLFWQEKGHDLYVNATELCYLLHKPKLAYYFMEKNKALLLLGTVSSKNYAKQFGIPSTVIENERKLKKRIHLLEANYSISDNNELADIKESIVKSKNKLNRYQDSILSIYPEYAKAIHKIDILSYDDFINNYVQDDQAILHYIMSDTISFGLVTTSGGSNIFELNKDDRLDSLLQKHLTFLRLPINEISEFNDFKTNARSTLEALIPKSIYNEINGKSITIIPDQKLQQLPFETLVSNIDSSIYLIERNDIHYQYSISYNFMNNELDRKPKNIFIGIAPQQFDKHNLSPLSQSSNEVKEINKLYKGDIYLSENANSEKLVENIFDYKIIHLSTHASSEQLSAPWIAFHDAKIYLDEINSTKTQAQLITLSACNTSIGEYKNGEGAMSLARSFFYAGANAIVSTLWATNDKSNKEIMVEFYREMNKGYNKSNALRQAKIKYLDSNNGSALSPYYWGAPIIIGNNQNITYQAMIFSDVTILSIALFLMAIFFILFRILKRRNN